MTILMTIIICLYVFGGSALCLYYSMKFQDRHPDEEKE
jgi:hypothetical protein